MRAYTRIFLNEICVDIAKRLEIAVYDADYYWLDCIFYRERDTEHFGDSAIYAKSITVALEHEHNHKGTAVEMNKLQLFNAPLKVLVTYAQLQSQREECLNKYQRIIEGASIFEDFAERNRQLVIFGSIDGEEITWHFHEFRSGGFIDLKCSKFASAPLLTNRPSNQRYRQSSLDDSSCYRNACRLACSTIARAASAC